MSGGTGHSKNLCVRCLLCNEKISYNREQTELLINHVKVFHPYIEVARLKSTDSNDNIFPDEERRKSVRELTGKGSNDDIKTRRHSGKKSRKQGVWRPGSGKLLCKKCGAKSVPVCKRKSDMRFGKNIGKTCFQLWCWPFSYLPLICSAESLDIYCKECNTFIGTYDYRTESIHDPISSQAMGSSTIPNRVSLSSSAPNITLKALQTYDTNKCDNE